MSNIVPIAQAQPAALAVPEYAKKYLKGGGAYAADVGDIDVSDIGLNFLKVVQGLSKEAKPGWGGKPENKPLPVGTMILSRSQTIIPEGTKIILMLRNTRYIKWEGKPGDGNMIDSCEHANDPKIVREDGLKFTRNEAGDNVPPNWTKYVNFWVISELNPEEPAILSFYRTSLKAARTWTRELMRLTKGWNLPMFLFRYRLDTPTWVQDGDRSWPQFTVNFDSFTPEAALPFAEKAYQNSLELYHATSIQGQIDPASSENTRVRAPAEDELESLEDALPMASSVPLKNADPTINPQLPPPNLAASALTQGLNQNVATAVSAPVMVSAAAPSQAAPAAPAAQAAPPPKPVPQTATSSLFG